MRLKIKVNNQLIPKYCAGIRIGTVVSLKEMNVVNGIVEFVRSCTLNGWLVSEIGVVNSVDIHQKKNKKLSLNS
ncbi:hypothetical protein [Mycoplasma sp. CSL7475-4]|uniref:hypothetical protein n=1 Tax=Mycoplasma sp. CSL7475-4 TaxID=2973942 RepID=UPI00216AC932|nr:hypothetical protein [Mycoplasma sp. CSL7475-4]